MFRLSRAFRLRSSLPIGAYTRNWQSQSRFIQSQPPQRVQHVRFQPPRFSKRRLATFAIYSTCIGGYLYWVFPEIEVEIQEGEEEIVEHGSEGFEGQRAEEPDWADEESRFIPLTWAKKLPRTYYKGSDPEWQEFKKIAPDQQKHKRIYSDLIGILIQGAAAHPRLSRELGQDPKVGRHWLDITFPDGPPQEWSRTGIEIGDGFIALSEQRISAEQHDRNSRILMPTGTFNSLVAYYKTLWGFQYRKVKQALGFESNAEPGSSEYRANNMLRMLEIQQAKQQAKQQARSMTKPQTNPGSTGVDPSSSGMQSTGTDQLRKISSDSDADRPWYMPSIKPGPPGEVPMEEVIASMEFAHALQKNWQPGKQEPPRGTFVVAGLVQLKGRLSAITFDVQAFYDPRISRFAVVNVQPRSMKRWKQSPRGGM